MLVTLVTLVTLHHGEEAYRALAHAAGGGESRQGGGEGCHYNLHNQLNPFFVAVHACSFL